MNDKEKKKELNLKRFGNQIVKKLWLIVLAIICGALLAGLISVYLVTPQYRSSVKFYVHNDDLSDDDQSADISTGDIEASKSLVDTYIVILTSRSCLNEVIDSAELDFSLNELESMISANSLNDTEVFEVYVTGPDPLENMKIANTIAEILPSQIGEIVEDASVKVIDYADGAAKPISPNKSRNIFLGALIGVALSVGWIALKELLDKTIRSISDITRWCSYPILAIMPDMTLTHKSPKKRDAEERTLFGDNISDAASEAYRLLRTKLLHSLDSDHGCLVIGVSSAKAGEGKSLFSINLAYSLAQLRKRVLLIDCDMRSSTLAATLGTEKAVGLSDYLNDRLSINDLNCSDRTKQGSVAVQVIMAGTASPNPTELLSSEKMKELMSTLREQYDYIVLDLPNVGEFSDAMVVSKLTDGILLVVSQNVCDSSALTKAINRFEAVEARIMGILFNRSSDVQLI